MVESIKEVNTVVQVDNDTEDVDVDDSILDTYHHSEDTAKPF